MLEASVVITFCNQKASPSHSLLLMHASEQNYSWVDLEGIRVNLGADLGGVCGACRVHDDVAICAQSGVNPFLGLLDVTKREIKTTRVLEQCKDPHSICLRGDYIYVVSTGTNEIYRVRCVGSVLGREELFWQYPGVRHDTDEVHLNGITSHEGRFIASCFGQRTREGKWGANGKVFFLDGGRSVCEGLEQPHTPLVMVDKLFFAESAADKVHLYVEDDSGNWRQRHEWVMPGYTRGLAVTGSTLLVGISSARRISRSKKTANEKSLRNSSTAIVSIDLETLEAAQVNDLNAFGKEIYDIVPVGGEAAISGTALQAIAERMRETECILDKYIAANTSLRSQLENTRRDEAHANAERKAVYESKAWSLTEPMKALRETIAGNRGRLRRMQQGLRIAIRGPKPAVQRSMHDIFSEIYRGNYWKGEESRSGTGSDLTQTAAIRQLLPELMTQIGAQSILDIPCGDFHWMKEVDLAVNYTGGDVVAELINRNQELYGNDKRRFVMLDISKDALPEVDLVFCRDLLVHLSFRDIFSALSNIKRSGSRYLLTTTFTDRKVNNDIESGQWRPLNFEQSPFNFMSPLKLIKEECTEGGGSWGDKSLGLWRISDLCVDAKG